MLYFDEPSKNTNNELKYSAILHTKTSNKLLIIQLFRTKLLASDNRERVTEMERRVNVSTKRTNNSLYSIVEYLYSFPAFPYNN